MVVFSSCVAPEPKDEPRAGPPVSRGCPWASGGLWEPPPLAKRAAVRCTTTPASRLVARRRRLLPRPPPPSAFRRLYESGGLPCRVVYGVSGRRPRGVGWTVDDVLDLDLGFYAALCVGALGEDGEPCGFLALEAFCDLAYAGGPAHRCASLGPAVAPALKAALRAGDAACARRALVALHAYATCDAVDRGGLGVCGRVLPLASVAAAVAIAKTRHPAVADYADTVLGVLEVHGGPGALKAIVSGVRTYVSRAGAPLPDD